MSLRILYQDNDLVAVDKPAGFHVHPPENPSIRVSSARVCLHLLKKQLGEYLYPVHRIDPPTAGVVIFALNRASATALCDQFAQKTVSKTYYAVVRGWLGEHGVIDRPLKADSAEGTVAASTHFTRLAQIELPTPVGKYPSARYSLISASPITGRYHQIRRHMNGFAHPILGDTVYGDGDHNRFFRDRFKLNSLLLKAQRLTFQHPATGKATVIHSKWTGAWHRVFDLFGLCPF